MTRAPKITHKLAQINWATHAARDIEARHRGFGHHQPLWANLSSSTSPSLDAANKPRTTKAPKDPLVQLTAVRVPEDDIPMSVSSRADEAGSRPGTVVLDKQKGGARVLALTKDGWLEVEKVKAAGKKEVLAREWWNGLPKDVRMRGWGVFE